MDGVFMRAVLRRIAICCIVAAFFWSVSLIRDRNALNSELIRLHIVANSDTSEDQMIKLQVRDAVIHSLCSDLENIGDVTQAKIYLEQNLPKIENLANQALQMAGFDGKAVATLCRDAFDTRYYDTFSLPAGVYESLRIVIGEGAGKNWWCVAFPSLCLPSTSRGFVETAVGAGFSPSLTGTIRQKQGYELRFYLLDAMGQLENIFFDG